MYTLIEDDYDYAETEAASLEDALSIAKSNVDANNYEPELKKTFWVKVATRCEETQEFVCAKVQCDPKEPDCIDDKDHNWQAPYEIVGGIKESPGVWGHSGGVIINKVCLNCGCRKTTDTWAQDPCDGEQGLTSVEYEPNYYGLPNEEQ